MKRIIQVCVFSVLAGLLSISVLAQRGGVLNPSVKEIPYDLVPNFLKLPPNVYMGEGIGVARDSKGHVYTYTRSGATRLYEFDEKGNFIREISPGNYGFEMAHGVRVDAADNIWIVDEGTNMVVKFNPEGRTTMVIGHRPDPFVGLPTAATFYSNANPPKTYEFDRPTDVAFDPNGNFFVADGYGNSRVAKYDKNGRFVKTTGSRGNGAGQLNTPHSIQADAKGNVYVADRGNNRIQVYDTNLAFKKTITGIGAPWTLQVTNKYVYSGDGTGKLYQLDRNSGKLLGWAQTGLGYGQTGCIIHSLHAESDNVLYRGSCSEWDIEKITIK